MSKLYQAYCALLVSLMALANHQGIAFSSLFATAAKAEHAANQYHK